MGATLQGPSDAMLQAITELWQIPQPGPNNILATPAFVRLREACRDGYPNAGNIGPCFALSTALKALGLPCKLQSEDANLASSANEAAANLDSALRATTSKRFHLAPLDLASKFPQLDFGRAKVCQLTPDELRLLFDETRLKRTFRSPNFDADRFSKFHWLVVEEIINLEKEPEARAIPILFEDLSQDLGRIEPHNQRIPIAFEEALFFLLLAPWERWSSKREVDWRGFRIPWVYTVDSDVFVSPKLPMSAASLSWETQSFCNEYGETIEYELPTESPLRDEARLELVSWDQEYWLTVKRSKKTYLFETPIAHFFVRAFFADGIDEFLAQIITIEAALGLQADNGSGRLKKRMAGLLGDNCYARQYGELFNLRSAFIHGRTMAPISTSDRLRARSLARRVVEALIRVTQTQVIESREKFLDDLLDRGAAIA